MRLLAAMLLAVCLAGPARADGASAPTVLRDVVYRVVDGRALRLDLAVPGGDGPFPAVLFVHGGGWISGNRGFYDDEVRRLAGRGYVAATVSYRLAQVGEGNDSIDAFPAALHDVQAALRFLRANAAEHRLDPRRVGIVGESAGGHLALLAGLTRPADGLEEPAPAGSSDRPPAAVDRPPADVQAVVNYYGPSDFAAFVGRDAATDLLLRAFLGGRPGAWKPADPLRYVRDDAPPILTFHGAADRIVPVAQSRALDAAVRKAGGRHELVVFEGAGHGFRGQTAEEARRRMDAFLDRVLKGDE